MAFDLPVDTITLNQPNELITSHVFRLFEIQITHFLNLSGERFAFLSNGWLHRWYVRIVFVWGTGWFVKHKNIFHLWELFIVFRCIVSCHVFNINIFWMFHLNVDSLTQYHKSARHSSNAFTARNSYLLVVCERRCAPSNIKKIRIRRVPFPSYFHSFIYMVSVYNKCEWPISPLLFIVLSTEFCLQSISLIHSLCVSMSTNWNLFVLLSIMVSMQFHSISTSYLLDAILVSFFLSRAY